MANKSTTEPRQTGAPASPQQVKWDDSSMRTTYANVCNVTGTREEVALIFGTNQTGITDQGLRVAIDNRVIVSPYAAKRLAALLNNVVSEYEKRFGTLGE